MGMPEIIAYIAPVRQHDGRIIWQTFKTEEEAIAADYRTEEELEAALKAGAGAVSKKSTG